MSGEHLRSSQVARRGERDLGFWVKRLGVRETEQLD
jgi:hypothetical protein